MEINICKICMEFDRNIADNIRRNLTNVVNYSSNAQSLEKIIWNSNSEYLPYSLPFD